MARYSCTLHDCGVPGEIKAACKAYLTRFPDGHYAGDMHYRISFIDFNNKDEDLTDKIIRELGEYMGKHPDDLANGSIYCLVADTYLKKKADPGADPESQRKELRTYEDGALDAFKKALATDSPDDIIEYAFDSAVHILQGRKDWNGIAELQKEFGNKVIKAQPLHS